MSLRMDEKNVAPDFRAFQVEVQPLLEVLILLLLLLSALFF
jgi:hypothetical protein